MGFDQAAVNDLYSRVMSGALQTGLFETVNGHEPKSAPGNGLTAAVWVDMITGVGAASGLSATSGVVTLNVRLYTPFLQEPPDAIDPNILAAASTLLSLYTGGFTLGATVRNIDLLGTFGRPLAAQAQYITQDNTAYRVMTITLPVVVNDLWTQGA